MPDRGGHACPANPQSDRQSPVLWFIVICVGLASVSVVAVLIGLASRARFGNRPESALQLYPHVLEDLHLSQISHILINFVFLGKKPRQAVGGLQC